MLFVRVLQQTLTVDVQDVSSVTMTVTTVTTVTAVTTINIRCWSKGWGGMVEGSILKAFSRVGGYGPTGESPTLAYPTPHKIEIQQNDLCYNAFITDIFTPNSTLNQLCITLSRLMGRASAAYSYRRIHIMSYDPDRTTH